MWSWLVFLGVSPNTYIQITLRFNALNAKGHSLYLKPNFKTFPNKKFYLKNLLTVQ